MGHSVPPSYANVQIRQGWFPTAVNKIGKQFYSHVKLFWGFTVLRFRHTYSTGGWPQIPSPVFPLLLGRAAIFAGLAPFTGIHVGYKPRRAFFMLFPPVQCPRSPVPSTLCAACYKRTILLPSCHTFWTVAQLCFGELLYILNLLQMHNAVAEFLLWSCHTFRTCYRCTMLLQTQNVTTVRCSRSAIILDVCSQGLWEYLCICIFLYLLTFCVSWNIKVLKKNFMTKRTMMLHTQNVTTVKSLI